MSEFTQAQILQIIQIAHQKHRWPDFSLKNLRGANLADLPLSSADFSGANLREADLKNAILTDANFIEANLCRANLEHTNLCNADLIEADLSLANLKWADLSGANLAGANLSGAILSNANLFKTHLESTNFVRTNLDSVDMNGAVIRYTTFSATDLGQVKHLDTIKHKGPSEIGFNTLILAKGKIPNAFLRGCGLSDWHIELAKLYHPNLTAKEILSITNKIREFFPIQYYSCFISYSSQDEAFAQRLHADLQQKGVRCWFAPEDIKIGDKFRDTIDQSIRIHDKLLIILSENSIKSTWVETEVEKAFAEERKRKHIVLFPVRLDDAVLETEKAWAAEIHETRHIGDFSRWKDHDSYQKAFERLLRDLKAEG